MLKDQGKTLGTAVDRIAAAYKISSFQLALWYKSYKETGDANES
jgi:hypothetical protein